MTIDYRSDTLTKPTPAMLEAMMNAHVGDDVYGEDPTINLLQEKLADIFGMEAALFCASGTMCNQIAIRLHTQPQDEVICDHRSHIYRYEAGGIAANSLASVRLLDGPRGILNADMIAEAINPDDMHFPPSSLVSLENTVNKGGGVCYEMENLEEIHQFCQKEQLGLHLDGARLFNALVAKKQDPKDFGRIFDTISVCLSKGLGAPVGSVLLLPKKWLPKAQRIRKMMGGGMRQGGYLAAAGLYAITHHVERLAQDHKHARQIEEVLIKHPGILEVMPVETNIIIFQPDPSWMTVSQLIEVLGKEGVKVSPFGKEYIRIVTHLDISEQMVDKSIKILEKTSSRVTVG
ncbi:MAG: GntG family PLP-dependent aldolase [Bacteroidota bacterium]